jgi:hypothetical protein
MRSAQRDQGGTLTFGAGVADAPSGSGVAQPGGIPFTFTRTATGVYDYRISGRLVPLSVNANPNYLNGNHAAVSGLGPGFFSIATYNNGTVVNVGHFWTCTARDLRA